MGQAKQRGSKEVRMAQAKARNLEQMRRQREAYPQKEKAVAPKPPPPKKA